MNEVRTLAEMPMDKEFNGELCHATGYEWFDGKEWWNEYEESVSTAKWHDIKFIAKQIDPIRCWNPY